MSMYDIPTDGCNLEIMGYPFFAENVNPNEAFRRREYNFNALVGGTMDVTPGAYVGLDFSITTHVFIDPDRPDEYNSIFQEMMSKPVEVVSPDLGGRFNAIVVVKPERDKVNALKLTISVKEVPDSQSLIPGEEFTVPGPRKVETKKDKKKGKDKDSKDKDSKSKGSNKNSKGKGKGKGSKNKGSKRNTETKKNKGRRK